MNNNRQLKNIQELLDIMALLRSKDGCAWDRAQTPSSLQKHILEEAYELVEAIDKDNPAEICDELGDLLLQVVFQAQIFSEEGKFGMAEVAGAISSKLKRRHPHIFAGADHEGHEQRWEEIKKQERADRGLPDTLDQSIPKTLPALKRCTKVSKKRPLPSAAACLQQMQQRLTQLQTAPTPETLEDHLTELLFGICQFSAANDIDPEELLRRHTCRLISEIDSENNM